MANDRGERAAGQHRLAGCSERLAYPCWLHCLELFEQSLERWECLDELGRGLLADTWYSWDVVGRISDQRLVLGEPLRREPIPFEDCLPVVDTVITEALTTRQDNANALVDQLKEIGIAGDDQDVQSLFDSLASECSDEVIRFVPFRCNDRYRQRVKQLTNAVELSLEVVRGLRPVRLILTEKVLPKAFPTIEADDHVIGLEVVQYLEQHAGETENDMRRLAAARCQCRRKRMVGTIGETVSIDEDQCGT